MEDDGLGGVVHGGGAGAGQSSDQVLTGGVHDEGVNGAAFDHVFVAVEGVEIGLGGGGEGEERAGKEDEGKGLHGAGRQLEGDGVGREEGPGAAVDGDDVRGEGRLFEGVVEIEVESPVAGGGVIDGAGAGPGGVGDEAVEHADHGAVIGEGLAAPVFEEAGEVFDAAAVVGAVGGDVAGENGGVDGVVGGGAAGDAAGAVGGVPITGEDGDGIGKNGGGSGLGGVEGAEVDGGAVGGDVIVADDIKGVGGDDGEAEGGEVGAVGEDDAGLGNDAVVGGVVGAGGDAGDPLVTITVDVAELVTSWGGRWCWC